MWSYRLLIGILSDTHNAVERTQVAVEMLCAEGAEILIHCGDLAIPEIVEVCACRPFHFVFGNHDADMVPELRRAAEEFGANCLEWGGTFDVDGNVIAVTHGHLINDLKPLVEIQPDYLCTGHWHITFDIKEDGIRRINPGALFKAEEFTVALLDTNADTVRFLTLND